MNALACAILASGAGDLTGASSVPQLIARAMSSIHYFALAVSLCIFLYAIARNYAQFGEHAGVRFAASLLVALVMVFAFPKICDSIQTATENYAASASESIEDMFCWLTKQKISASALGTEKMSIAQKIAHLPESIMHSIQAALCNIFYVNGIWLGKGIRDMAYFIFKCRYNGAMCLTPVFFAGLLIPETRQTGVNFIISCCGLALMPLCFLFGDLCNIWLAEHMRHFLGLGDMGAFWTPRGRSRIFLQRGFQHRADWDVSLGTGMACRQAEFFQRREFFDHAGMAAHADGGDVDAGIHELFLAKSPVKSIQSRHHVAQTCAPHAVRSIQRQHHGAMRD